MKAFCLLVFCFFSQVSIAKVIEISVPDEGVTYEKIDVNFDDSLTIVGPKVFSNGEYLPIFHGSYIFDEGGSAAYNTVRLSVASCALFGYYGTSNHSIRLSTADETRAAYLRYNSKMKKTFLQKVVTLEIQYIVDSIQCSK